MGLVLQSLKFPDSSSPLFFQFFTHSGFYKAYPGTGVKSMGRNGFFLPSFSRWDTEKRDLTPGPAVVPSRGHDASAVFPEKGVFFSTGKNELRVTRSSKISVCSAGIAAWLELLGISPAVMPCLHFCGNFRVCLGLIPNFALRSQIK